MKRLWLILGLLLFNFGFMSPAEAASARASFSVSSRFEAKASGTVIASHLVNVTNTSEQALLTLNLSLPSDKARGISVSYGDGRAIPFSVTEGEGTSGDVPFKFRQLNLDLPRRIVGKGKKWQIKVSYGADGLVDMQGLSRSIFIPKVDLGLSPSSVRATLIVPSDYPQANYQPQVAKVSTIGNGRQILFNNNHLRDGAIILSFGQSGVYEAVLKQTLANKSWLPQLLTFRLPPDLNSQTVFIKNISPKPDRLELDEHGNTLAHYWVWPGSPREVTAQAQIQIRHQRYALGKSTKLTANEGTSAYITATEWWPADGAAAAAAQKLVKPNVAVIKNVQAIHDFVVQQLKYDPGASERLPADQVLQKASGGYLNYADLLTAMLRSQGIPARLVAGSAYTSGLKDPAAAGHAWVEAYVSGVGWLTLDPLWAEKFPGFFGNSSFEHVGLAIFNESDVSVAVINELAGSLTLTPDPSAMPAKDLGALNLEATRTIILPWLRLDAVMVTNNAGYVVDNLETEGQHIGSLAPGETKKFTKFTSGGFSAFNEKLMITNGKEPKVLKEVSAAVSFWPLAALGLALASGVVMIQWHKRKTKAKVAPQPVEDPAGAEEPAQHHDIVASHIHGSMHYPDPGSEDKRD